MPAWIATATTYIPWIITAAAASSAALPQAAPGSAWAMARKIIDLLAFNFGSAKNAPK